MCRQHEREHVAHGDGDSTNGHRLVAEAVQKLRDSYKRLVTCDGSRAPFWKLVVQVAPSWLLLLFTVIMLQGTCGGKLLYCKNCRLRAALLPVR